MNRKQIVTMWAGIIVFTILCLNPPMKRISSRSRNYRSSYRISVSDLVLFGLADLLVVGGLIITLKTKKK